MRRVGIIILIAMLLLLLGGYTAAWFIIAGRVEASAAEATETLRAQNLDLSWQNLRVAGFPFSFRVELSQARLRATAVNPPVELRAPLLSAGTHPWGFRVWQLAAPEGLTVAAAGIEPATSLEAQAMSGSLYAQSDGSAQLWFGLTQPVAAFGLKASARYADLWLNLPPHVPQSHIEPAGTVGIVAYALELPLVPPPLHNPVDQFGFSGTLMGSFPPGPAQQAAQAWRDQGGTVELENFALRWGSLAVDGSGTLALDSQLQPTGAFSGSVEGFNDLMNALVAGGQLRGSDARLAQIALSMLAKPGADGRPQISTSFTIQNGQMFLGPAKLGPAPRILW